MKYKILNQKHEEEYDENGDLVDLPAIEEENEWEEFDTKQDDNEETLEESIHSFLRHVRDNGCSPSCSLPMSRHDWFIRDSEIRMDGSYDSTSIFFVEVSDDELAEINKQLKG